MAIGWTSRTGAHVDRQSIHTTHDVLLRTEFNKFLNFFSY
jgi:hypothetical protein